jgi:CAAX protease family protein
VGRYVLWRVGFRWYLFVLIGIPAILVVGTVVLPGTLASFQGPTPRMLLIYPLVFVYTVFLGGPLGEETGWRCYLSPSREAVWATNATGTK